MSIFGWREAAGWRVVAERRERKIAAQARIIKELLARNRKLRGMIGKPSELDREEA